MFAHVTVFWQRLFETLLILNVRPGVNMYHSYTTGREYRRE